MKEASEQTDVPTDGLVHCFHQLGDLSLVEETLLLKGRAFFLDGVHRWIHHAFDHNSQGLCGLGHHQAQHPWTTQTVSRTQAATCKPARHQPFASSGTNDIPGEEARRTAFSAATVRANGAVMFTVFSMQDWPIGKNFEPLTRAPFLYTWKNMAFPAKLT